MVMHFPISSGLQMGTLTEKPTRTLTARWMTIPTWTAKRTQRSTVTLIHSPMRSLREILTVTVIQKQMGLHWG